MYYPTDNGTIHAILGVRRRYDASIRSGIRRSRSSWCTKSYGCEELMDFHVIYQAKAAEYLLAVTYLLTFVPFWRYVTGPKPIYKADTVVRASQIHAAHAM